MRLACEALSVRLGTRSVLRTIDFEVAPGAFVGLVGPNGAGKTTLLRALAGLVSPAGGRVTLDGLPLAALPRETRGRRIAALFQGEGAGWPMTVCEIVALGRLPHRRAFARPSSADRAAIARAMEMTETLPFAARRLCDLSSGERMRVLLARALAVEAEILLADEPITALDPAHQLDAMALLRSIARRGTGVVAVLHDLTLAARFCDRLVVLSDGRVAADAAPEAALTDTLLERVFGIAAARGAHPDGTPYILPWTKSGPPAAPHEESAR